MLRVAMCWASVLLAMVSAGADAAKGPRVPPGKWAVEYAKEYCVLLRDGLAGEPGVAVQTRPFTDEHDLLLYVPRTRGKERWIKGWLSIGGVASGAERWINIGEPRRAHKLIFTRISTDELANIAVANSIRLSSAEQLDLTASLPMVTKAMSALRRCEIDLAGKWGISALEMDGLASWAQSETDLRSMFWSRDRSTVGMLRSPVRAMLDIDAQGALVGCRIVKSSRVASVDARFCETLRKEGKFRTATDFSGKPVRDKMVTPLITSARLR